jgi:hypothetical protein
MGEGEVEVVSSEQNVLADRDPAQVRRCALRLRLDREETEVGGAATEVDHQHVSGPVRDWIRVAQMARSRAAHLGFPPGVEGSLRFLQQQRAGGKPGGGGGFEGELLGHRVERSRHGHGHFLVREGRIGMRGVPGIGEDAEQPGLCLDRAQQIRWGEVGRAERKKRRAAVGRVVGQPGLGGAHHPARHLGRPGPGPAAGDPGVASGGQVEAGR